MAHIFIADTREGAATIERILGSAHEYTVAHRLDEAEALVSERRYDLLVVGVHFDESRMFDLLLYLRNDPEADNVPLVCCCSQDTRITRTMRDALVFAVELLGAWMYIDMQEFGVNGKGDEMIKRSMERCLTDRDRSKTQRRRLELQKQREEVQDLRLRLEKEDWSLELENDIGDLRKRLAALLAELMGLHVDSTRQQDTVFRSREDSSHGSKHIFAEENRLTECESLQTEAEAKQSRSEKELIDREEDKARGGRKRLIENSWREHATDGP